MPLTKQQLLIPRVLCIGGEKGKPIHPLDCYLTCGDVLTRSNEKSWKSKDFDMNFYFCDEWIEQFPHLFKPLPWWYGRTVEEMPEYVKNEYHVFNVEKWVIDKTAYLGFVYVHKGYKELSIDLTPADEADYQEYQKQKQ